LLWTSGTFLHDVVFQELGHYALHAAQTVTSKRSSPRPQHRPDERNDRARLRGPLPYVILSLQRDLPISVVRRAVLAIVVAASAI
jgi:hypothetical protein